MNRYSDNERPDGENRLSRRALLRLTAAGAGAAALGLRGKSAEARPPTADAVRAANPSTAADHEQFSRHELVKPDALASLQNAGRHTPGAPLSAAKFAVALKANTNRLATQVSQGDVVVYEGDDSTRSDRWIAVIQFRNQRSRESIVGFATFTAPPASINRLHANRRFVALSDLSTSVDGAGQPRHIEFHAASSAGNQVATYRLSQQSWTELPPFEEEAA